MTNNYHNSQWPQVISIEVITQTRVPGLGSEELIIKSKSNEIPSSERGLHLSSLIHSYINCLTNEHRGLSSVVMNQTSEIKQVKRIRAKSSHSP